MRLNGGQGCRTNQVQKVNVKPSPKGKRKTKTVNQKPVKIKKMYALPRETLWTMKSSKLLKTVMIPSIEKDLSQEV